MSIPYIGEMRWFTFQFAPRGWALCNGQLLAINSNQALFSLLGTTFGGNGTTNFALPNMQGNVAVHSGTGFNLGQAGGEPGHTLTLNELPSHTHPANAVSTAGTAAAPAGAYWAASTAGDSMYTTAAPNSTMIGGTVGPSTGGGQPHANQQPYLVMNLCIALQGIFPSRN